MNRVERPAFALELKSKFILVERTWPGVTPFQETTTNRNCDKGFESMELSHFRCDGAAPKVGRSSPQNGIFGDSGASWGE
jgi:hypothetical protein